MDSARNCLLPFKKTVLDSEIESAKMLITVKESTGTAYNTIEF
jgi:hypothetical protein